MSDCRMEVVVLIPIRRHSGFWHQQHGSERPGSKYFCIQEAHNSTDKHAAEGPKDWWGLAGEFSKSFSSICLVWQIIQGSAINIIIWCLFSTYKPLYNSHKWCNLRILSFRFEQVVK